MKKPIGFACLLVLLSHLLNGCASVTSNAYRPYDEVGERQLKQKQASTGPKSRHKGRKARGDKRLYQGIPYHLPMAMMSVAIDLSKSESGIFEDIAMRVDTEYVPDEEALFYLNPSVNSLFETEHKVKVSNGLLTSVETDETGKAGELITSLVETVIQFKKLGVARASAQSATANPFLTDNELPTPEEVRHILGLLQSEQLNYQYGIESGLFKQYLPGSKGMMYLTSETKPVGRAMTVNRRETQDEPFDGIFTRTLQRANTTLDLYIDPNKLRNERKVELTKAIAERDNAISELQKLSTKNKGERCEAEQIEDAKNNKQILTEKVNLIAQIRTQGGLSREELALFGEQTTDLKSLRSEAQSFITECEGKQSTFESAEKNVENAKKKKQEYLDFLKKINDGEVLKEPYLVKQSRGIVLVPNRFQTVRVPIERGLIGRTTNNLSFSDGVLTSYDSHHPAAGVEFVKSIGSALESLVALPAELIQLKIDTTGKKKNLHQAELELVKTQRELDKESSATLLRIQRIEQELDLKKKRDELDEYNAEPSPPDEATLLEQNKIIEGLRGELAELKLTQKCTQVKIDNLGNPDFTVPVACNTVAEEP